jgi:hypothetical protein
MKRLQIITLFLILTRFIFATGQHFEYVILNGDTLITYSNIFKKYPNYKELSKKIYKEIENEDMKINPQNYTSNEHVALEDYSTWIVKNNKLVLTEIKSGSAKTVYVDLRKIFGDKVKEGTILADWLTDTITLSKGKVLAEGAPPMHENEIDLIINNGSLTKTTTYKNYIARISKFRLGESFIYSNVKWDSLPSFKGKYIQAFIEIKIDKKGRFKSLEKGSFVFIDSQIVTDKDNVFLEEACRIAKLVPEWDVIYKKNKIVNRQFTVLFDERMKRKYAR